MKRDAPTLEKIIRDADYSACIQFFLESTPAEGFAVQMLVQKLTPWVIRRERDSMEAMMGGITKKLASPESEIGPGVRVADSSESVEDRRTAIRRCHVMGLCVLTTGTFPQMKKLDFRFDPHDDPDLIIKVLRNVQVPWLQDWIEHLVSNRNHFHFQFLVEAGLCMPPTNSIDEYIMGLLARRSVGSTDSAEIHTAFWSHTIWQFFEVEGSGDRSLAAVDKYCRNEDRTWAYRMKQWSEEGRVPRARLLDASLGALARDFAQFRASWFSRFHEYMEPNLSERAARTDGYLALLESTIPPTVTFALDSLKLIDTVKPLTAPQLAPRLEAVLRGKNKANSLGILALTETILARDPQQRSALLLGILGGLVSENVEIQLKIVKILLKYSAEIDANTKTRLAEMEEFIVPSARKLITPLLSKKEPVLSAERVPESRPSLVPLLDPTRLVTPILSYEELIERASFIIENPENWAEVERVFSALVKFPIAKDLAIQKLAKPLLIRTTKLFDKQSQKYEESDLNWAAILRVVLAWLRADDLELHTDFLCPIEEQLPAVAAIFHRGRLRISRFHFERLHGIIKLCLGGDRLPLLSEPTHSGFYVDSAQLAERIRLWQQSGETPCPYDAVVALLRLAPENREAALEKSGGLTGELGAAFRYALGPDEAIGMETHLWIAAARVHYRYKDDPKLAAAYPDLGPGGAMWPQITWLPGWSEVHYGFRPGDKTKTPIIHKYLAMKFELIPEPPENISTTHLPILLHSSHYSYFKKAIAFSWPSWAFVVFASYWPCGREAIHFNGVVCAGTSTKNMDVAQLGLLVSFESLNNPYEAFGDNARLLLNLGLSCPNADGRTSSTNAFVSGVSSGRLCAKALGQSMRIIFSSGLILPARVRKSLDEVVRVSIPHKRAVVEYLTQVFQGDSAQSPDGTMKLLELYHELLVGLNETVRDEAVLTYLRTFPGGGRGGKLAKQILGLVK